MLHVSLPTTINKYIRISPFEGFKDIWNSSKIQKIFSTKASLIKEGVSIGDLLKELKGIEEITEIDKLREFGGKIVVFDEEMLVKMLVVNGKKVQFQIKPLGDEKWVIKILNFFMFL